MSDQLRADYEALTSGAGFVVLENRCFVRLTGDDRQAFFHNFCTNEIKQLQPGQVCEAFVLNTKGKLLGFVHVIATDEELLLTGYGQQAAALISHLDMYLIREDVELADATAEQASVFVCGQQASEKLAAAGFEVPAQNHSCESKLGEFSFRISNLELAGFGFLIACPASALDQLTTTLVNAKIAACTPEALNVVRVEQKTPWFGIDADDSNLPQELQRDEQAINFNKGCYLGQETVARIDARGRVNQLLVGLKFTGDPPADGEVLIQDEKSAGRVTSVVHSLRDKCPIGLGYVRRAFKEPGTTIGNTVVLD